MTDPTAAAVPARFIGMPARDYPLDTVRHCQSCCNYRAESPAWSLGAGVVGMVGAVVLAVLTLISPAQNGAAVNFATWAAFFLPPLVFGFLALRHPRADIPRILAIIGIVGGVFGLLNLGLTKRRLAADLDSGALRGDAASSFTCGYMAGAVLLGVGLNALLHWGWVESVASLLFLFWLVGETREAFEEVLEHRPESGRD
jgi:divalent metal cation (Fe/Co/Zn/Cd) transporter